MPFPAPTAQARAVHLGTADSPTVGQLLELLSQVLARAGARRSSVDRCLGSWPIATRGATSPNSSRICFCTIEALPAIACFSASRNGAGPQESAPNSRPTSCRGRRGPAASLRARPPRLPTSGKLRRRATPCQTKAASCRPARHPLSDVVHRSSWANSSVAVAFTARATASPPPMHSEAMPILPAAAPWPAAG